MWVRAFSLILQLFLLSVAYSRGEDSPGGIYDKELPLGNIHSIESFFYQAKNCTSDADCRHLGKCETKDGNKLCNCKNGTSGDFCEIVDDCAKDLETCGTSDDVSCVFDVALEKAVCKCDNDTKTYVPDEERCMSPCTRYDQCGLNGYCYHKIGDQTFCACSLGTTGDYCEIIEWCHTKKVECGVDNNATCTLGGKGKAYCKCDDPYLGFDYDEKICKDCSGCGENAHGEGGCVYRGGRRSCLCEFGYYTSEEGICEDCLCGLHGYGCSVKNGTKICKCYSGTSQNGDICVECSCGPGQTKCEFEDSKKLCTCKEGYAEEEGKCKKMCNDSESCQNGGQCVQNFCNCLNGTRGDLCEVVEYCNNFKCGRGSDCVYNVTSQKGSCECRNPKEVFDDYYDYCTECDCGSEMKSCSYVMGRKNCTCNIPYAERYGKCEFCGCKSHSSPYGCYFKYTDMVCQCDKGYVQYQDDCKECDCGENGLCSLNYWGSKDCKCNDGYTEEQGECKKCDCGENGYCSFDYDGNKICSCSNGYQEYEGTCLKCDCGANSDCKLLNYNMILCTCLSGYASLHGTCQPCDCYPGTNCVFENMFSKKCICPKGYADDLGTCKVCDCKVEGANCSLASAVNSCKCPAGYEQVPDPSSFLKNYCEDIDECDRYGVCPSSTDCVNTVGSYDCVCKQGYEEYYIYNIKKDGCRDIDECKRNYKPCDSENALCINTPGSYKCDCKMGYTLFRSYEEKKNICMSESRPWRTATIVVGVLSGIIIISILLIIISRRSR